MTAITRAENMDDLISRVSALLDVPINENSIPSEQQVIRWFNDAAILIVKLLPDERLAWAQHVMSYDNVGSELYLEGSNIIRIVAVSKYNYDCTEVTHKKLLSMRARFPYYATVQSPYYCRFGSQGKVRLRFLPESFGKVSVAYVRMPTAFYKNSSNQWEPDDYSVPAELEPVLVDYVVMKGKIQDEEPQQFQVLYQEWVQSLGIETQAKVTGVEE